MRVKELREATTNRKKGGKVGKGLGKGKSNPKVTSPYEQNKSLPMPTLGHLVTMTGREAHTIFQRASNQ